MYPAVISLFFLGMTLMLASLLPGFGQAYDGFMADSLARNFSGYRDAAVRYLNANPDSDTVPNSALELPTGYRYLAAWRTELIGNGVYAYGSPSHEASLSELARLSGGKAGVNRGGMLQPAGIPLPNSIPDGAVVGIVRQTHEQP